MPRISFAGAVLAAIVLGFAYEPTVRGASTSHGTRSVARAPNGTPVDFTPEGTQPGLAVEIAGPEDCRFCHEPNEPGDGAFMPHSTWSGSMMANATRDPIFWAALDVANRDAPGAGDFCLRCHSPSGWLGGRVHKTGVGPPVSGENGCLLEGDLDDWEGTGNDFAGVSCHYCHRMMPTGPSGQGIRLHNGNAWIDDSLSCPTPPGSYGPCRRGPYGYPQGGAIPEPPHGWTYSAFHVKAEICGTCHDVSSPVTSAGPFRTLILSDGTNTGQAFPVERTFSEWNQSDYADVIFADGFAAGPGPRLRRGQPCQDCHMRTSTDPRAHACDANAPGSRAGDLPVHELVGGNSWIPQVLKALYGSPSQLDREAAYDRTTAWARELLTQRTAAIETTLDPFTRGAPQLVARVKVTNLSGHKLPSGYGEGRRMWIHLQARDATNALVFESGAYDTATAVLTRDAQAKVYEVLQGVWERFGQSGQCVTRDGQGRELFNFVLNNCVARDNRIPPLGFRGALDVETRPVGYTYPETSPGSGRLVNFDVTTYQIPVPPGAPLPITVTATLRYQTSSKEYVDFLRDYAVENGIPTENAMCSRTGTVGPQNKSRGQFVHDVWTQHGRSAPEAMVTSSAATGS